MPAPTCPSSAKVLRADSGPKHTEEEGRLGARRRRGRRVPGKTHRQNPLPEEGVSRPGGSSRGAGAEQDGDAMPRDVLGATS